VTHVSKDAQPEEKQVTRLPDGRVLKGPRPAQRQQAEFWSEVNQSASEIAPPPQAPTERPAARPRRFPAAQGKTVRTVKTGTTARAGGSAARREKKPRHSVSGGPVPRPSQKGFKWPTAGED
jgi:hypothetical protein